MNPSICFRSWCTQSPRARYFIGVDVIFSAVAEAASLVFEWPGHFELTAIVQVVGDRDGAEDHGSYIYIVRAPFTRHRASPAVLNSPKKQKTPRQDAIRRIVPNAHVG